MHKHIKGTASHPGFQPPLLFKRRGICFVIGLVVAYPQLLIRVYFLSLIFWDVYYDITCHILLHNITR